MSSEGGEAGVTMPKLTPAARRARLNLAVALIALSVVAVFVRIVSGLQAAGLWSGW